MSAKLDDDNLKTGIAYLKQVKCYTSIVYTEQRILSTVLFNKYVKMIDYAWDTILRGGPNVPVWLAYAKLVKIKLYMLHPSQLNNNVSISEMLEQVRSKFDTELGSSSYLVGLTLLIWTDISDNNIRIVQSYQMVEKKVLKGLHCMDQTFRSQINRKVIRGRLIHAHSCTTNLKYVDALRICKDIETAMLGEYSDTHYLWGALFREFTHLYRRLSDQNNGDIYKVKLENWKIIRRFKLRDDKEDVRQNWVVSKIWPKLKRLESQNEYYTYIEMARTLSNHYGS